MKVPEKSMLGAGGVWGQDKRMACLNNRAHLLPPSQDIRQGK